jgi:ferredoxin/flavodoxin---NADP+ reductase
VAVHAGGLRVERTVPDGYGHITGSGSFENHPVQAVYRAMGYAARPLAGVPFDEVTRTIPHRAGAVRGEPGLYVTGWIKRGCTGLVGATAFDARQTVTTLLRLATETPSRAGAPGGVDALLAARGVMPIDWPGWLRITAAERHRGTRITDRTELIRIAHAT